MDAYPTAILFSKLCEKLFKKCGERMILPQRKKLRLEKYDYSSPGAYFVTISTYNRQKIFWTDNELNELGRIVEESILDIHNHHKFVKVDNYAIMPNHVHLIITIGCDALPDDDDVLLNEIMGKNKYDDLKIVVGCFKASVTRKIHKKYANLKIWQRFYNDHIIKDKTEYSIIWDYIENNPNVWIAKNKGESF